MKAVCVHPRLARVRYRRKVHIPARMYKYSNAIRFCWSDGFPVEGWVDCCGSAEAVQDALMTSAGRDELGSWRLCRAGDDSGSIPGSLLRVPLAWFARWTRRRLQLVWLLLLQRRGFNPAQKPHLIISLFAAWYSWLRMKGWGDFGLALALPRSRLVKSARRGLER